MALVVRDVLSEKVNKWGISKSEISRRLGISSDLVARSLAGKRKIDANEFLALCEILELDFSDFHESEIGKNRKS